MEKRTSSLQAYLDNLDKDDLSSDEDDWGFFVDMEHKSKNATNTNTNNTMHKKKKIVNHYHHHYHHNNRNHNNDYDDNDNNYYNKDYNNLTQCGNILVCLAIAAYLFLV